MINQIDTENADLDIQAALITVLTATPSATRAMLCQGLIKLGDGVKNLDGTGGAFTLTVTVGGQTIQPDPQTITFSTAVRSAVWTTQFPVPAASEVVLRVLSPNSGDSDVDVTAYLYQVESDGRMIKATRNNRVLLKDPIDFKWYAVLYEDASTTIEISRRELQDKNGDPISDFAAGELTQELASSI